MAKILLHFCIKPVLRARSYTISATVDQQEIQQFQKLTSQWWDEFGPTCGLHSLNRLRVPLIRDGLINEGRVSKSYVESSTPLKDISILDVGCGGGILSEALARLGGNVTGIDANQDLISVAKQHAARSKLEIGYMFTSIDEHSKQSYESYDAIVASEIVEHVTEKEQFIKACADCLKPSGSLFITTINKTQLANFLAIFAVETVLEVVPRGTHQFAKFIEPHRLQRILTDCGLRTKLVHGMFYNIISNKWSWCSDTSINYCLHAVKVTKK